MTLSRECEAVRIPSGERMLLPKNAEVDLMQKLGGHYTVSTPWGLFRIAQKDGDAIGKHDEPTSPRSSRAALTLERVYDTLREVFDPEIPVNVLDLGLVYACEAKDLPDGTKRVEIELSMTAPGCGMGDVIAEEVRSRVKALAGVSEVEVELVWDPPWDPERMSDAARLQLGWM